jgi:hypothetical protein
MGFWGAISDATLLLAVRGEEGRFGAPMKPAVAQALYDSVTHAGECDIFPRAALEAAGCHLAKWDDAVKRGTIRFSDGNYSVAMDPLTKQGVSPFIAKLDEWRSPEWHAKYAEQIKQLPANQR